MTISPMAYPDITMTDKYANPVDETGKKLDVPQVGFESLLIERAFPARARRSLGKSGYA